jgi:hypothetical protein
MNLLVGLLCGVLIVSFAIYAYHMGWKLLHEVDDEDDEV